MEVCAFFFLFGSVLLSCVASHISEVRVLRRRRLLACGEVLKGAGNAQGVCSRFRQEAVSTR